MAYITTSQLSSRLGSQLYARLTDRVNGASADSVVAQQIVDEAEALANSFLAQRYATPIDVTAHAELAHVLAARVLDLAEHLAWRGTPFVSVIPDRVLFLHEEAVQWFERVAQGTQPLPASSPPASRTALDDSPRYDSNARKFTDSELDGL